MVALQTNAFGWPHYAGLMLRLYTAVLPADTLYTYAHTHTSILTI